MLNYKSFPDGLLISLAKQNNDAKFNLKVRKILRDRYSKRPYREIYLEYKMSSDLKRQALSDAIANYLINDNLFIETEVLDQILPVISIDALWSLCKKDNDFIRNRALMVLFDKMRELEKKNNLRKIEKVDRAKILVLKGENKNDKY